MKRIQERDVGLNVLVVLFGKHHGLDRADRTMQLACEGPAFGQELRHAFDIGSLNGLPSRQVALKGLVNVGGDDARRFDLLKCTQQSTIDGVWLPIRESTHKDRRNTAPNRLSASPERVWVLLRAQERRASILVVGAHLSSKPPVHPFGQIVPQRVARPCAGASTKPNNQRTAAAPDS